MKDIRTIDFDEELNIFQKAARAEIKRTHATGRATPHADEKGLYFLYPDGRKVYKGNLNERRKTSACHVCRTERVR